MKTLIAVNPDQIKVDESIGYRDYETPANQVEISELANSILARGLETPLLGYVDADKTPVLVAGFRRLRAIKMIRSKDPSKFVVVPMYADDSPPKMLDVLLDSIASNEQSPPTLLELGGVIARLRTEFKYSQAQIGQAVGKSQATIARGEWLTTLPDPVKDQIRNGKISIRHCLDMMADKEAGKKLLAEIEGGEPAVSAKKTSKQSADKEPGYKDLYEDAWSFSQKFYESAVPQDDAKSYEQMTKDELITLVDNHLKDLRKVAKAHQIALYENPIEQDEEEVE